MKVEFLPTKHKDGVCSHVRRNCKELMLEAFQGLMGWGLQYSSVIVKTHRNQGVLETVTQQL